MAFETKKSSNPMQDANYFSKFLFLWILPLFRLGYGKELTLEDLYGIPSYFQSTKLRKRLKRAWIEQVAKSKESGPPSMLKAMLSTFTWSYIPWGILLTIDECIVRTSIPLFLKYFILAFSENNWDKKVEFGGFLLVATLFHTILYQITSFAAFSVGMQCRVAATSLVYAKVLRLGISTNHYENSGKAINIVANDVSRFDQCFYYVPYLFVGTLQTAVLTYMLWTELGVSCLAGMTFILFLVLFQYVMGKLIAKYRSTTAQATDARSQLTNEVLNATRIIKMCAWESPFEASLYKSRILESNQLARSAVTRGAQMSAYLSISKIVPFLSFLAFVMTQHQITAATLFFAVAYYDVMRRTVVSIMPMGLSGVGEIAVSCRRISEFLLLPEVERSRFSVSQPNKSTPTERAGEISMSDFTGGWESSSLTLKYINMHINRPSLSMVVGPVGCGKSTLLAALLGEIQPSSGECNVHGKVSYCSQEPWIFSGTVKDNILFGDAFDHSRYNAVINACQMRRDLEQFSNGDMTQVGDKGSALSGGQKTRINLARTIYKRADIYLLDDPLAALDPTVAVAVFKKVIKSFLKDKTVVLVTHQTKFSSQCDLIICFDQTGRIRRMGEFNDLAEEMGFSTTASNAEFELESNEDEDEEEIDSDSVTPEFQNSSPDKEKSEESRASGSVSWSTYWRFMASGENLCLTLMICCGLILSQTVSTFSDYWLTLWTNPRNQQENKTEYLSIFGGALGILYALTTVTGIVYFLHCVKIGSNLHRKVVGAVINAKMTFFDANSGGRILNRLTKDLGNVDDSLPITLYDTLTVFLTAAGAIVILAIADYFTVIPSLIFIPILLVLRRVYINTARDVKRIEATCRSPNFTYLSSTLSGLTTIRAQGMQRTVTHQFDELLDTHSSPALLNLAATRAFGLWLETATFFLLMAVVAVFLFSRGTTAEYVGLAISAVLGLSGSFQWGVRQSAETSNSMISVERLLEYSQLEPEETIKSHPIPQPQWPSASPEIEFTDVSLSYENNKVLNSLRFKIEGGESIGIAGRTGSGKTSIISILLRLYEFSGSIKIDGVDIKSVPLQHLRKQIAVVPQDPVLFQGSIRYNLDPTGEHDDDTLWSALEEVGMKSSLENLSHTVRNGGSNFSVGEKQLLCLARAILKNAKIIVLDEANANLDHETDENIQRIINNTCKGKTRLIIAHRMDTFRKCDKILLMGAGEILEYGALEELLCNPESQVCQIFRDNDA